MVLGIMQPYIFPYLGYFHLIDACDTFVFYDDVSYIKQGWINRNRLQLGTQEYLFTIPLDNPGSFRKIHEIPTHPKLFLDWKNKFYKTLEQSYSKAPFYTAMLKIATQTLDTPAENIGEICKTGIYQVCAYLNIQKNWIHSSTQFNNEHLQSVNRVLDICGQTNASHYINASGGRSLYAQEVFQAKGLQLSFVQATLPPYLHNKIPALPGLSILDMIAWVSPEELQHFLKQYKLEA